MFDIGWAELFVIAIVTLVVVGPRDIPKVLYEVGKWVRKARSVTREFHRHIDDMMRETELDELRKQANDARSFNLRQQIENTIDPDGTLRRGVDVDGANRAAAPASKPGQLSLEEVIARARVEEEDEPDNPAFQTPRPAMASAPAAPATAPPKPESTPAPALARAPDNPPQRG